MTRHLVIGFSIMAMITACGGGSDGGGGGGGGGGTPTPTVFETLADHLWVTTHSYPGWITGCTDCTEHLSVEITGPTAGVYRYESPAWIATADVGSTYTVGESLCHFNADAAANEVTGFTPEERMVVELSNFDDTCYGIANDQVMQMVVGSTVPDTNGDIYLFQYLIFDPTVPEDPFPGWLCAGGAAEALKICASGNGTDAACAPVGPADGTSACTLPDGIDL